MPAELSDRLQANDAALAARLACGDAAALTPIYQRHRAQVYRFALLWSGSAGGGGRRDAGRLRAPADQADDYDAGARTAAAVAAGHRAQLRASPHRRRRALRRQRRRGRAAGARRSTRRRPSPRSTTQRDLARLRAAIAALPPHYRDVLVLVELAERSYAEAAAICGCELNTVRSRLSRARGLIARWLDVEPQRANAAKG